MLTWVSAEEAAQWPEGIPVLVRQTYRWNDLRSYFLLTYHDRAKAEKWRGNGEIIVHWAKIEPDETPRGECVHVAYSV